jgi:cobalt-zinc-cadmium efflux system membrane fusion protein
MRRLVLVLAALAAAGCGQKEKEAGPQFSVEQHSVVVFEAGSPQIESITSVPIEPRREMTLCFNGRLVWNEDRTVRVFAPFAGRVVSIAVRPGDRVKRGHTLAVLAAPELGVVQAEARKAEQDHSLAQKNLARVQELYMAGVTPPRTCRRRRPTSGAPAPSARARWKSSSSTARPTPWTRRSRSRARSPAWWSRGT